MSGPTLFQPIQVGKTLLQHRVVLAPMTRLKASAKGHVPTLRLAKPYYTQRSSQPGSLLISEGTFIAFEAGGYDSVPGIWNKEQIDAWREITDAVHANGCFIYMQLWALGRCGQAETYNENGFDRVGPSAIPMAPMAVQPKEFVLPDFKQYDTPRALTEAEIRQYVEWYAQAAKNAVYGAGFDGVEVHNANGYLLDQFLQDVSNMRTDEYGGSVEARCKFGLDVVDAVVKAVGEERVGIRISPWKTHHSVGMKDPIPQFSHYIRSIANKYPKFSYLHVVEADENGRKSNDFLREIWAPRPYISGGRYSRASAIARSEKTGNLVSFGRWYISNPDLPARLMKNLPLTPFNPEHFYVPLQYENTGKGYIDYAFADERPQHYGATFHL